MIELHSPCPPSDCPSSTLTRTSIWRHGLPLSLCKTFLGLKCSELPFLFCCIQGQILEEFKLLIKTKENGVALIYVVLRTFHSLWCNTVIFNGQRLTYMFLMSLLRYSSWNSVSMRFCIGPSPTYELNSEMSFIYAGQEKQLKVLFFP